MALNYHFDLYPRTDPKDGTRLVRFTNLQSAQFRGEANGTGSGEFTIRADDPEADFIDPLGLQYVRVVRDDGATELVVGGFFLERGEYKALDEDETKLLKFGGAGPLTIFQRAVMDFDSWIDDPFIGTDPQPEGVWPLYLAGTGNELGAILWRVLHELEEPGRHQDPLPFTSLGFTHLLDSNAAAWVRTTGDFTAQVSESVLSIVRRLMQMGLYVEVDPDTFEVLAYEPETHRRNRTGGAWATDVVRFQAPTGGDILTGNIKSDAMRGLEAVVRRNAILTGSADTWEWVTDPGVTVPWEGGFVVDDESGTSLNDAGEAQLAARGDAGDTLRLRMKLGDDEASGVYLPFEHVLLDDIVTVHTGIGQWDYNEAEFPVAALTISLRPGGDWDACADLGSTYLSMAERAFQAQPVGHHTHPPNPQLCRIGSQNNADCDDLLAGDLTAISTPNGDLAGGSETNWSGGDAIEDPPGAWGYQQIFLGGNVIEYAGWAGYTFLAGQRYAVDCYFWGTAAHALTLGIPGTDSADDPLPAPGGPGTHDNIDADSHGLGDAIHRICWTPTANRAGASVVLRITRAATGSTQVDDVQAYLVEGILGDLPADVGLVAAVGTSVRASRCDHVHAHGEHSPSGTHHHGTAQIEGYAVGAPTTPDYLVGTAQAGLSAEIVVGTTPGGELGNTWDSPTVDASHSGSTHAAAQAAAEATADAALTTHEGTPHGSDPADDSAAWMPLTTVVGGEPELVWDGDDSLIPTLSAF